jgi:hypothetical protein
MTLDSRQPEDHLLNVAAHEQALYVAYSSLSDSRIDYNVRKWDTIRAASIIALGVLAAVAGLLSRNSISRVAAVVAAVSLPVSAGLLWLWARTSITREAGLQYADEFSMYQIERLLGLHREIGEEDRWLPGYGFLFGEKHREPEYMTHGSSTPPDRQDLAWWIGQKTGSQSFLNRVDSLFGVFLVINIGFAVVLLSVAFRWTW